MSKDLRELIDRAKHADFSGVAQEEQRRSFAYGNANIENSRVTRETVDREAEKLREQKDSE